MSRQIFNRSVNVDGVNIFYREAGDKANPLLLLLHGFPSSSSMFKNLMTALADKFYLIAPDYPGFGYSDFPDKEHFEYTFENISAHISRFVKKLNLDSFTIYLHDYGCPIGLRVCMSDPGRIKSIIVQDGNAYEEGIIPQWDEVREYWKNPTEEKKKKVYAFLSEEGTRSQYYLGLPEEMADRVSPELWRSNWQLLQRPGNLDMQYDLNCDFKSNFDLYPEFQKYFRTHLPPALVIWGKHDPFFNVNEAHCYKRDLPGAQVHILNGAHEVLETNFDEVLLLISDFLDSDQ